MSRPSLLPRVRLHRPGLDVLTALCVVFILVQVVVTSLGGVAKVGESGFYEIVGLRRPGLLDGQVWQLVTHPFVHAGWLHLMFNWLIVFLIGGRVHQILGGRACLKIFFGGVLAGSLLHLLFHPKFPLGELGPSGELAAWPPLVGASAGAMALLLALTSLSPDSRMWPLMVSGKNLGRGLLAASLILFALTPGLNLPVLSFIGSWLVKHAGSEALFQIGHIYHFGGGLVGMLYVRRLLRSPVSLQKLQRARERREGVAT
ncbi:MAG: rhomboid family intramembrane serine protease [Roseibacillus sp.]